MLSTLGELIYAGSSTALVTATAPEHVLGRALARFQLSTGFSLAISPAIITALAARGPAALWVSLTAATLLAAAVVARPSAEPDWQQSRSTNSDNLTTLSRERADFRGNERRST